MRAARWLCALLPACGFCTIRLSPQNIELGALYRAVTVRIEGEIQAGSQLAVAVRGASVKEEFNKKGRVGPIWLNVGKVEISGVPSLLVSFWNVPLEQILSRQEADRLQLDKQAIIRQMRVRPPELDQPELREHYWALKTQQGAYRIGAGGLRLEPAGPDKQRYTVEFVWPRLGQPGDYTVSAYECREGKVIRESSATLSVRRVGLSAAVVNLAHNRPPVYGAMAVLVAAIAGFGIDLLVSRSARKRRKLRAAKLIGETEAEQPSASELRRAGH